MVFNAKEFWAVNEASSLSLATPARLSAGGYKTEFNTQLANLRATSEHMASNINSVSSKFVSHINSLTSNPTSGPAIRSAVRAMLTGPIVRILSAAMHNTSRNVSLSMKTQDANGDINVWVSIGLSVYFTMACSVLAATYLAAAYEKFTRTVSADNMPFVDAAVSDVVMLLGMAAMMDTMPSHTTRSLRTAHGKIFVFLLAQQMNYAALDASAVAHARAATNLLKNLNEDISGVHFVGATADGTINLIEWYLASAKETYIADADVDVCAAVGTVRQALALIKRVLVKLPLPPKLYRDKTTLETPTNVVQLASRITFNKIVTTTHYAPAQLEPSSVPGCAHGKCKVMVIVAFFAKWSGSSIKDKRRYFSMAAKRCQSERFMWCVYDVFDLREAAAVQEYAQAFPTYVVFYGEVDGTPTVLHRFHTIERLYAFYTKLTTCQSKVSFIE